MDGVGFDLEVRDLGRMAYADAFALQKQMQQDVIASRGSGAAKMYLLFVEHDPPVITVSRRKGARQHLIATPEQLEEAGVEVVETDRGGDITYHGPGQLVAYPILDLNEFGLRLHGYMRLLEQIVIDVLKEYGVEGYRDDSATGVWSDEGKICAMGVRVARWVTMHGLALNVATNLDHFNLIVPCGLAGRSVTSMRALLGDSCPIMDVVKGALVAGFESQLQTAVAE